MTNEEIKSVIDERDLEVFDEVKDFYLAIFRGKRHKVKADEVDQDELQGILSLGKSIEDNITKKTKLRLQKEKNEIDKETNASMASALLIQLHEQDSRVFEEASKIPLEERTTFEPPVAVEFNPGEIIAGEDNYTYSDFQRDHPVEDDD